MRDILAFCAGGIVFLTMATAAVSLGEVCQWWDSWIGVSRSTSGTVAFLKALPIIVGYVGGFFSGVMAIAWFADWARNK